MNISVTYLSQNSIGNPNPRLLRPATGRHISTCWRMNAPLLNMSDTRRALEKAPRDQGQMTSAPLPLEQRAILKDCASKTGGRESKNLKF